MANPKIPMQMGSNLPSLEREEEVETAIEQEEETERFEEVLGLEPGEADEEVIELEDGSVVINYKPTESPNQNPEFYANLAEEFDEGTLDALAYEYLDLIDVDKESRKDRDKQYED